MPNELKIVIDADVNKAIAGVQNLSKVISADFTKATNAASASAANLSKEVTASVSKINSALSGLKVTSLDVAVNTSSIDASIKSIQSKFASLADPQLNVLANTDLAEAKIKELVGDLSALKGSEIFIRANDTQALQKINEIEKELNSLVGKQINLSVTADLTKIEQLQAKINSLKVTPVDVVVNTPGLDAQIKTIQSKFAALVDPQINVLANTTQAEAQIKDLLGELSTLKGSEIFIRANDAQALTVINQVEAELNTLLDKQINLNINSTDAFQKISALENELLGLQQLAIDPNISSTQLSVFEANIKRIKSEIAALKGEAVVIPITVPPIPPNAIRSINELQQELDELKAKINFSKDITEISRLGQEFKRVESQIANIKVAGNLSGQFDKLGLAGKKAADGLKAIPNASNPATTSLINLGRVVQDAPFGIIGVANNINPLLESFQRLRVESRSTGAAFKAFGAALIGGGGIGLGVSVITSLLTQFALSNRGATEESNKFTKAIEANAEAVRKKEDEFKTSLDKASQSLLNQTDKLQDLNKILVSTAANIDEITSATIRQGVAQFVFDKKNVELQKLLNAEIQNELKLRKQADIRAVVPEFDPGIISTDPLKKQAADAKQTLGTLNFLGAGLESFFKKFASGGKDASKAFEKFIDDTISKARQFAKEFGNAFVVPNLDDSFFKTKDEIFKLSKKLLADVSKGQLQIKLPVITEFEFLPTETKLTEAQIQELTKGFFEGVRVEANIPLEVTADVSLSRESIDKINKKLDLREQFKILGSVGLKEFDKIFKGIANTDFTGMNKAIAEATKQLQGMMEIAMTLNQAIGQGLSSAFNSVFDAILEGKSAFKALGEAIKQLVVGTIKAIAQMLILKAVTSLIFPGGGGLIRGLGSGLINGAITGSANFGGIGGSPFSNIIQIVGSSRVSGNDIVTTYTRATNSNGRFG